MRSSSHGFTLIELLVAVSIVAVLAALALPVLRGALVRAGVAKCASNLGQWASAYVLYAQDNNGALPNALVNGEATWQDAIAPYLIGTATLPFRFALRAKLGCPQDKKSDWKYGNDEYLDPAAYPHAPARIWSISSRPNFVVMADCGSNFWSAQASTGASGIDYTRHGGVANFGFADGHVEALNATAAAVRGMVLLLP